MTNARAFEATTYLKVAQQQEIARLARNLDAKAREYANQCSDLSVIEVRPSPLALGNNNPDPYIWATVHIGDFYLRQCEMVAICDCMLFFIHYDHHNVNTETPSQ